MKLIICCLLAYLVRIEADDNAQAGPYEQQTSLNCTFENGLCPLWHQDNHDIFDWTHYRGSTPSYPTGPSVDHTTGSNLGWYMYIETSGPKQIGDTARLVSKTLPATNQTCLFFWYHMYGPDINTLRVLVKNGNQESPIWIQTGSQGDRWKEGRTPVISKSQFEIILEGVVGNDERGDIAIDDISLLNGTCSMTVNNDCTFENGICSWYQDKTDYYDWIRSRGALAPSSSGPSADHTNGTRWGYYIYIYSMNKIQGKAARLMSMPMHAINQTCLSFWYHMYGKDINTLRVLVKTLSQERTVWSRTGQSGHRWLQGQVTLGSQDQFQVVFEGVSGNNNEGNIALDDFTFVNGMCNISESCRDQTCSNVGHAYCLNNTGYCYCASGIYGKHCEFVQYNCTFENGICSWHQDLADSFDWTRYRGPHYPDTTGPSIDHTTGTSLGYYMSIQSGIIRYGKAARLVSKPHPPTNATCLSFWYHMYGNDVNTLRVLVNGSHNVTVWSRSRESGDIWRQAQVTLSSQEQFQIIFEAIASINYNFGDIAIDDIKTVDGTCNISESCRDQTCINGGHAYCLNNIGYCYCQAFFDGKHCEFVSRNCTFEEGICIFWNQDNNDVFDWTRHIRATSSYNTGPYRDHTTGSGWYIYIETSSRKYGDTARLVSMTLPATNQTCISFWYHMYGTDINTLRVLIKNGNQETMVWIQSGNHGERWIHGQTTVASESQFKIIFEGIAGSSNEGDIALDDITVLNGTCDVTDQFDCTFEDYYCNWYQDNTDDYDWKRHQGPRYPNSTGPLVDHTNGTSLGYYIYIYSNWNMLGKTARLMSLPIPATNQTCLSFWYYMYGLYVNTLRVLVKRGNQSLTVWSRTGQSGARWLQGQVTMSSKDLFQVIFEGVSGLINEGDIALDDVTFVKGMCNISETCRDQTCYNLGHAYCLNDKGYCYCSIGIHGKHCEFVQYNCTFENGICSWHQDQTDSFDWTRYRGPISPDTTGPSFDHTTGTSMGYYMYIYSGRYRQGKAARLISHTLPATNQTCLSFWYHMYGTTVSTLRVLVRKGSYNATVWSRAGQSGDRWLQGQVTLSSQILFKVIFEAVAGSNYDEGDIAIDDITFVNGTCFISESCRNQICHNGGHAYCLNNTGYCYCQDNSYGKHCEVVAYNCTFQNNLCSFWHQDSKDVFDWTRYLGPTPTYNTGPSVDHTFKKISGWYMYIETSPPRKYGDIARLVSKTFPATNQTCLSFWYHMYGTEINTLRVLVRKENQETIVWSRTGQSGDRWLQGEVFVLSKSQFEVIFEGVVGNGFKGDIAIDDVDVINENCSFSVDQFDCTFEKSICNWYQDTTDSYDWTRSRGPRFPILTGPSVDHTKGTNLGFYIYIYSAQYLHGKTARLISMPIHATNHTCLSFWYHMYGVDINTLSVLVKKGSQNLTIWSRTGQSGYRWLQGQVTLSSEGPYQVIFEGVSGNGSEGDIALDDVTFVNGMCNISESCRNQTCSNGGHAYCLNNVGHCYCPSGTSGRNCEFVITQYNCTFEDGICSWYQDLTDSFDWIRYRGPVSPDTTGPSIDHTTGTDVGHYMYIYSNINRHGKTARLISKTLPSTNQTCFSFWYYMYGYDVNTLKVLVNGSEDVTVWSRTGQSVNRWLQGQVTLSSEDAFQVILEGVAGTDYNGDIAIDDITFSNGTCNISESCRDHTCHNGGHAYCLNNTGYCYCQDSFYGAHCELLSHNCTFEKGVCSTFWNQDNKDVFNWTRHHGPTLTANTGPSVDHTTRTSSGWYMYIETSPPRQYGDTARLVSKNLPATNQTCLSFWYHMYGNDVNMLRVLIRKGNQETAVWSRIKQHGDTWLHGQVTIESQSQFQIVFEGIAGSSWEGDIAIDDIFYLSRACHLSVSTTPRTTTKQAWTNAGTTTKVWTIPTTSSIKQEKCTTLSTCYNGGTSRCHSGKQVCDCPPNYTGPYCRQLLTICPVINCLNNGTMVCAISGNKAFCQCKVGFTGDRCQTSANVSCSSGECNQSTSLTPTSMLIALVLLLVIGG